MKRQDAFFTTYPYPTGTIYLYVPTESACNRGARVIAVPMETTRRCSREFCEWLRAGDLRQQRTAALGDGVDIVDSETPDIGAPAAARPREVSVAGEEAEYRGALLEREAIQVVSLGTLMPEQQ